MRVMHSSRFLVLAVELVLFVSISAQGDMCGLPAPDPAKTCISVRLPWNPQPMYFCTDKSTFRYRNQCQPRFANNCGVNSLRQDILLVASPWDCCPMVSYPDSCVNQQCPPPPLNRNCQTMEPSPNTPWECCPSYFCEENMTPDTCHFKRLEPSCNTPPQGKTNCVAFVDPYGCCPKFQCDGDAKPGQCPAEAEAMRFASRFNATNMVFFGPGGPGHPMLVPGPGGPGFVGPAGTAAGAGSAAGQAEMHVEAPPADAPPAEAAPEGAPARQAVPAGGFTVAAPAIACISDSNCPENMKCCSNDMNVYMKEEGRYFFRNRNPTYGYCTETAAAASSNTRSLKYSASTH